MIYLKTDEEIELMREANQLVGKTLGEVAKHIVPGVSTLQLDKIAEEFIRDNGAVPAFLGYGGFPNSICASAPQELASKAQHIASQNSPAAGRCSHKMCHAQSRL